MPAGGDLASITAKPQFVYEEEKEYKNVVGRAVDGTRQSVSVYAAAVRRWRLHYSVMTDSEKAELMTFWDDNQGTLTGFTWTNPVDSTSYNVSFAEPIKFDKISANTWSVDPIILEQRP